MLLELKKAFLDKQIPIYQTAIKAKVNPNKVSKIIHGLAEATPQERDRLCRELNRPESELFPNQGATSA